MPSSVQALVEPCEVRSARFVEPIDQPGRALCDRTTFWGLAVEHPKRAVELVTVLVAQFVAVGGEVGGKCLHINRPAIRATHRVHRQRHPVEPERPVERGRECDYFHIQIRVVAADRLDTELVVLTETPSLGLFVAECRGHVPGFPGNHGVVLDEHTD